MTLDKLLRTLGILMMVFAFISGLYLKISSSDGEWSFDSGYSFKIGLFLVGAAVYYFARKKSI
jgi:hypothetical protein